MHALNQTGIRRWVALSEGAGGSVGWLTARACSPNGSDGARNADSRLL